MKTHPYLRYKSRLVARGFSQKQGMDYEETYSPTLNFTSIRMLLSYAASYDRELIHWDIGTAFLNGILEEDIYIEVPKGFTFLSGIEVPEGHCLKLNKSIYGLKQASRT